MKVFVALIFDPRKCAYTTRFGPRPVRYFGLLVIGRSEPFAAREMRRLAWRQERTVVNSRHIHCLTFDQLADRLEEHLARFSLPAKKK
jgi:hypothetical protein